MERENLSLIKRLQHNSVAQVILFVFTVVYVLSPVDIISDAVPVIGWLDDSAVVLAELAQYFLYMKRKRAEFKTAKNDSSNENGENK